MAIPESGGSGLPSFDAIPTFIVNNVKSDNVANIQKGLDSLIEWAEETGDASAARALVEDAWSRENDMAGYLGGTRVPLDNFWESMRALDPERDVVETTSVPASGARLTPTLIRDLQRDYPNLHEVSVDDNGQVLVRVEGELSPAEMRAIGNTVGGSVMVESIGGTGDAAPEPEGSGPTAGTGGAGGAGGTGGGGDTWSQQDGSLPEDGTGRQIPGGEELWHVDGKVYLAYRNPEHPDLWMIWHVESPDRLQAIYGDTTPAFDREMTEGQLKKMSPWYGGLAAELENTSESPWVQFNSDFKEASKLRPWLNDPTMQAVMMGAYLEGRAPTQDELAQTDWWNEHTAAERAWMEQSVTLGREEIARRRDDQSSKVAEALRQAGVSNAPKELVDYIAEQSLTGKWSEQYLSGQIRKLADPMAPGRLDSGVTDLLDGIDLDTTRKFEDQVRGLMEEWLGPDLGRFKDEDVAKWAGRLRNDPDAQVELEETLRQQRKVILPGYADNLTYRQIITPVENLATQVWGRPVQDSAFLVDLANTMDYSEMSKRLRKKGRQQGVRKVWQDMLGAAGSTPVGERVVRSTI